MARRFVEHSFWQVVALLIIATFLVQPMSVSAHGTAWLETEHLFLPVVQSTDPIIAAVDEQLRGDFNLWVDVDDDLEQFEFHQYVLTLESGERVVILLAEHHDVTLAADMVKLDGRRVAFTGRWAGKEFNLFEDGTLARVFSAHTVQAEGILAEPNWDEVTGRITAALYDTEQQRPELVGAWSEIIAWPEIPIDATLLPTGKVLFWGLNRTGLTTLTYLWEPTTGHITSILSPHTNLFCSGHALLPSGDLLATGGHELRNGYGSKNSNLFLSHAEGWQRGPDMNAGRWYPSNCVLGNGEILTLGGSYHNGRMTVQNTLGQVYQRDGTWRDLTGVQVNAGNYPWLFLMPDGRVFLAGPRRRPMFIQPDGVGAWTPAPASNYGNRGSGGAVMYEPGKVLIVGGGGTNSAEVIDLNLPNPTWRYVDSMLFRRNYMQATLLADGSVLATGGTTASKNDARDAILAAELWDPATEQWRLLSSMSVYRLYHAVALLLPDGRVLVGGGTRPINGVQQPNIQLFSPPYLFQGTRPEVQAAPEIITYGESFTVDTADAESIAQVTLIRLGSMTHGTNQNQRINHLEFTAQGNELTIEPPAHGNLAPPGHYMLFLINHNGVPSVAPIIQLLD
jgi:hypothetical protein